MPPLSHLISCTPTKSDLYLAQERQTNMTKLTVAFRNSTNAPQKKKSSLYRPVSIIDYIPEGNNHEPVQIRYYVRNPILFSFPSRVIQRQEEE